MVSLLMHVRSGLCKRSLMYHMDTDILVTSANFVDRALTTVQRGRSLRKEAVFWKCVPVVLCVFSIFHR